MVVFFYDTTVAKFWSITNKQIAAFFGRKFSSGNLTLFSGKIFVFAVKNWNEADDHNDEKQLKHIILFA